MPPDFLVAWAHFGHSSVASTAARGDSGKNNLSLGALPIAEDLGLTYLPRVFEWGREPHGRAFGLPAIVLCWMRPQNEEQWPHCPQVGSGPQHNTGQQKAEAERLKSERTRQRGLEAMKLVCK
ncbi:hypothetical protein GGS20DRAFT_586005 [Poronia punctata]|nr:hypothetical protein GGS20DRAFT_586005 [Poronia punctata]